MTKVISAEAQPAAAAAGDGHTLSSVLESLRHEAGLQPLAPYLSKFFADQVARNLTSVPRLLAVVRAIAAVLANKTLNMARSSLRWRWRLTAHFPRRQTAAMWRLPSQLRRRR